MNVLYLNSLSIIDVFNKIDIFFKNNLESAQFFNPHDLNSKSLSIILETVNKDKYILFMDDINIIGYGLLRGWDEGFDIPSLGIMIDQAYKGTGSSYKIMELLHSIAKSNGANKVRLTVLKKNLSAINLYKNIGYDLTEKDKNNLIGFKQL